MRGTIIGDDRGPALTTRVSKGFSRRQVAGAAGIAARTLARIERGEQKPLWLTIDRLCDELDISTFTVVNRWAKDALDIPTNPAVAPGLGLRALRRQRRMTLVVFAQLSGVSAATLSRFERGLTASRLLARRVGGPEIDFDDRDVVLHNDRLASVLGFGDCDALRTACIAAFALSAVRK